MERGSWVNHGRRGVRPIMEEGVRSILEGGELGQSWREGDVLQRYVSFPCDIRGSSSRGTVCQTEMRVSAHRSLFQSALLLIIFNMKREIGF